MTVSLPAMLLVAGLLSPAPSIDGIALALYYEDAAKGMHFDTMVDEIAEIGASHVSILVQWSQKDTSAVSIQPHPLETPSDAVVRRVIRRARERGLKVMLFPIVWVEKRAIGDWRGTLKPPDPDQWWKSYHRFIMHYAQLAQAEKVEIFSVGSELGSMEGRTARWKALVERVRKGFSGQLIYSANWDHYAHVTFWDAVDLVGLTGYYRLTQNDAETQANLTEAWDRIRIQLLDWHDGMGKPLVFTEVGYPSIDGAAISPWDYTTGRQLDLREQSMCLEAFRAVWAGERRLAGVFFWNWWGPGDGKNTWYTIKGKPAEAVVRLWMQDRAQRE